MSYLKKIIKLFITAILIYSPAFSHAEEAVITVDESTNIININPQNNTAPQVLNALATKIGFTLTGKLEAETTAITQPLQGNLQQLIEQLVKPQSVVVLFSSDKKGNKYISQVELLPTGNANSQFLNNGKTLTSEQSSSTPIETKTPTESRDVRRKARQQRRDERHAQGFGRINNQ